MRTDVALGRKREPGRSRRVRPTEEDSVGPSCVTAQQPQVASTERYWYSVCVYVPASLKHTR